MTLPDFFLVGASKSGTHSLYDWLRQHPGIFMPRVKAPRYFCNFGQEDYRFRFRTAEDYAALFAPARPGQAVGEATDVYMNYRDVAVRIREAVPGARIIALLREPVQRAFSIYHMNRRVAGTNAGRSFLEALEADIEIRRGFHGGPGEGLSQFYDTFPRAQILVLRFDDLQRDPATLIRRTYGFLGVDPDFVPEFAVANRGGIPKRPWLHRMLTHPQLRMASQHFLPESLVAAGKRVRDRNLAPHRLTGAERAGAYGYFHDDLLRTAALTGCDLSAWIQPDPATPTPTLALGPDTIPA